jgi:hypothetical protein
MSLQKSRKLLQGAKSTSYLSCCDAGSTVGGVAAVAAAAAEGIIMYRRRKAGITTMSGKTQPSNANTVQL